MRCRCGTSDKDLMVGICSEVVSVLFARCSSSRFALESSADPGVVGGGAEGGVGDDGGAQDAAWRCVS